MARIRSIKPDFWTSEQVMECSPNARLLFIGMWNFADDHGRLPNTPKTLKAQIFPADEVTAENIRRMVDELSSNDLVRSYVVDGKEFLYITGWHHQKIDKRQAAKYPDPPPREIVERSANDRRTVSTDLRGSEGIGRDRIGSDSVAGATGAVAPVDHRKRLFDEGLPKLAAMTGKGPDACRAFVGKCLKAAGDDAVTVLGLIEDAERNQAVDPTSWIVARLRNNQPPQGNSNGRRTVHDAADDLLARVRALDEPAPSGICDGTGEGPVRLLPPR